MSEFLHSDPSVYKHYVKAHKIKVDMKNQELWLQGCYIYDALIRLYPLLNAFHGDNATVEPYVNQPYPLTKEEQEKQRLQEERAKTERFIAQMKAHATMFNAQFNKGGG